MKRYGSRPEGSRSLLHSVTEKTAPGTLLIRLLAGNLFQYRINAEKGQAATILVK
jgi:hypothetical protein